MSTNARVTSTDTVLQRIFNEFLEMPGLRVTCQQAQRLWGLDRETCLHALGTLVDAKFLARTSRGMYARSSDGRAEYPTQHGTHWQ
jgi:Fic family protein